MCDSPPKLYSPMEIFTSRVVLVDPLLEAREEHDRVVDPGLVHVGRVPQAAGLPEPQGGRPGIAVVREDVLGLRIEVHVDHVDELRPFVFWSCSRSFWSHQGARGWDLPWRRRSGSQAQADGGVFGRVDSTRATPTPPVRRSPPRDRPRGWPWRRHWSSRAIRRRSWGPGGRRDGSRARGPSRCRGCTGRRCASRSPRRPCGSPRPSDGSSPAWTATLVMVGDLGANEAAVRSASRSCVRPVLIRRLLRTEHGDGERERRRVLRHPAEGGHGEHALDVVRGVGREKLAVRGDLHVLVEPVLAGVPGVTELPVVAGRGVPTPSPHRRAEPPARRIVGSLEDVHRDAVDHRIDGPSDGGAVHAQRDGPPRGRGDCRRTRLRRATGGCPLVGAARASLSSRT